MIDLVWMNIVDWLTRSLHEFINATDTCFVVAGCASPYGYWRTPEAITRHIPVPSIGEPVAESASAHGLRYPMDGLIVFNHPVTQGLDADEARGTAL